MDYVSNYVLMPVVAIAACLLVGWVVKPQTTIDEITINGENFSRKGLYVAMVKYITPVMLLFLLLQSLGMF
jgi:NSS family neurotransmitter:Na+ symporter